MEDINLTGSIKSELSLISAEECWDSDYGISIVQYSRGNGSVYFAFSNLLPNDVLFRPTLFLSELNELNESDKLPLWSDLSPKMLDLVMESSFDMLFIEHDDDSWSEDLAEEIWDESLAKGLDSVVTLGDDCYLTVYAGAICSVNWNGHPVLGKPCLENKVISPSLFRPSDELIKVIREMLDTDSEQLVSFEKFDQKFVELLPDGQKGCYLDLDFYASNDPWSYSDISDSDFLMLYSESGEIIAVIGMNDVLHKEDFALLMKEAGLVPTESNLNKAWEYFPRYLPCGTSLEKLALTAIEKVKTDIKEMSKPSLDEYISSASLRVSEHCPIDKSHSAER